MEPPKIIRLDEGLRIMEGAIQKVKIGEKIIGDEYIIHYTNCYNMCNQRHPYDYADEVYGLVKEAIEDIIYTKVLPSLAADKSVIQIICMWKDYNAKAKLLSILFAPVDKACSRANAKNEPIYELAVRLFSNVVVMELLEELLHATVSLIMRDRNGEAIDRELLKSISTFLMEIVGKRETYFQDQFEKTLLTSSIRHYSQLASQWLLCYSSKEYLLKVEKCMLEEKERASQTLDISLQDRLLKELHTVLIIETRKPLMKKRDAEKLDNTIYQELTRKCDRMIIW